jgi:type IV pilus assembly protein PilA
MNRPQGFTLIELMIVVAIIAILAAIAVSQYQDYVIRSQVSEGSALADGVKTAVAEFYDSNGRFPGANASAGLASATSILGQYVSQVDVGTVRGQIRARYGGTKAHLKLNNTMVLVFSAITNTGSINWVCRSDQLKSKWCASTCRCTAP